MSIFVDPAAQPDPEEELTLVTAAVMAKGTNPVPSIVLTGVGVTVTSLNVSLRELLGSRAHG
jgi:hypothetical protein